MGRGVTKDAIANSGVDNARATTNNNNAQSIYGSLLPQYQQMATNPQGYSAGDLSAMNTASQQGVGGAVAGAVGQGNLQAARTNNVGGFQPALDEASRQGGRQVSQNALGIQTDNANLKQQQMQTGLAGQSNLYGENQNAALQGMGLSNSALNAATGASNQTNSTIGMGLNTAMGILGSR